MNSTLIVLFCASLEIFPVQPSWAMKVRGKIIINQFVCMGAVQMAQVSYSSHTGSYNSHPISKKKIYIPILLVMNLYSDFLWEDKGLTLDKTEKKY